MERDPKGNNVPSYFGDNVNGVGFDQRKPDPSRLLQAYFYSVATLNYLRSLISGGLADLHKASSWKLGAILDPTVRDEYSAIVNQILDGLGFLKAIGADNAPSLKYVDMFTSHEGLLLNYESALTKKVGDNYYNLGAHFLWIGDRTRQIDMAHVEYFRGISNPIGIKVGPLTKPAELKQLVEVLNPLKEPGRLTLITRLGHDKVGTYLPDLIKAVQETHIPVVWSCDPCHGNTESVNVSGGPIKTRYFPKMLIEIQKTFRTHQENNSVLGGIHLELTGEEVTECVGGPGELEPGQLKEKYLTACDPRLNYTQSLAIAFQIAKDMGSQKELALSPKQSLNCSSGKRSRSTDLSNSSHKKAKTTGPPNAH